MRKETFVEKVACPWAFVEDRNIKGDRTGQTGKFLFFMQALLPPCSNALLPCLPRRTRALCGRSPCVDDMGMGRALFNPCDVIQIQVWD